MLVCKMNSGICQTVGEMFEII